MDQHHRDRLLRMQDRMSAMNDMARTLAHDLRNPLTNLALVEDQLRHDLEDRPEAVPYLDMVCRNVGRMREITDAMVRINLLPDLDTREVDAADVLKQVVDHLRDRAQAKQAVLTVDARPGAWIIRADRGLLTAALEHIGACVVGSISSGDRVTLICDGQADRVIITVEAQVSLPDPERPARVIRQGYRVLTAGSPAFFSHAHGILLAHGAVLVADPPEERTQRWRMEFPTTPDEG